MRDISLNFVVIRMCILAAVKSILKTVTLKEKHLIANNVKIFILE